MFGKKIQARILAAGLTACMLLAAPVYAEQEAVEETAADAVEAEEIEKDVETEELVLKLTEEKELAVLNATGKKAVQIFVKKAAEEEWGERISDVVLGTEEKIVYDLKLVAEDEEAFLFYNLPLNDMENLAVYAVEEGTYVVYTDAEQKEVSTEEFPVICTEESTPVYATYGLNVRAIPTTEGAILGGLQPGEEAARYGVASNGWCMIKRTEGYAFITGDYVTESAEEAEKIREQARAAAAAAVPVVEAPANHSPANRQRPKYPER